jgi:hypothetical protein
MCVIVAPWARPSSFRTTSCFDGVPACDDFCVGRLPAAERREDCRPAGFRSGLDLVRAATSAFGAAVAFAPLWSASFRRDRREPLVGDAQGEAPVIRPAPDRHVLPGPNLLDQAGGQEFCNELLGRSALRCRRQLRATILAL